MSSKSMCPSPSERETATALTAFSVCPGALGFLSSLRARPVMPSNNASETRTTKLFFILWLLSKQYTQEFLSSEEAGFLFGGRFAIKTMDNQEQCSTPKNHGVFFI